MKGLKKSIHIVIIVLLSIVVICLGTVIGIFITGGFQNPLEKDRNATGIVMKAEDETESEPGTEYIVIPSFDKLTFSAHSKNQDVNFYNPQKNKGIADFKVKLQLQDSNTTLYESDLIEPGKAVYKIEISEGLESGEYPAELIYYCFDSEGNMLNGATVQFTLIVK